MKYLVSITASAAMFLMGFTAVSVPANAAASLVSNGDFYASCGRKTPLTSDDKWSENGLACVGGMHYDRHISLWGDIVHQSGEVAGVDTSTYSGAIGFAAHLPFDDWGEVMMPFGLGLYNTRYDDIGRDNFGAMLRSGLSLIVNIGRFDEVQPFFKVGADLDWRIAGKNTGDDYGVVTNLGLGIRF